MLDLLQAEDDIIVGDNEPYQVSDLTDYTIPVHGEQPRSSSCRDRDPPGPDRDRGRPARLGRTLRPAAAGSAPPLQFTLTARTTMTDAAGRYSHPATRDVPVEIGATTLLFIDVQNFCAVRERRRVQGPVEHRVRREARLLLHRDGRPRRSQHAAPAGRLPRGRHRGHVHAHPQPHPGRPRPQPRLQDHRLQRAARTRGTAR